MRSVQVYIEGERDSNNYTEIELFKDETIGINLSIQNIQDISKVFTDFSQSFTVPASSVNNSVFKHYYENAVDLDPTLIDQRLRRNAYIEIDRTPFRSGKIQLEKANLKEGQAESYTITFYGDLVTLKDLFGEDKLSDLDYSNVSNPYSYSDVKDRLTDGATDYDVRYPLISSERLWSYGDATSTDISLNAINYTELFPAVKVAKIFEAIENKYSVNFNGLFLDDERFTKLFLWCKNALTPTDILQNQKLVVGTYANIFFNNGYIFDVDTTTNKILIDYTVIYSPYYNDRAQLYFTMNNLSDVNEPYFIDVYRNGVFNTTVNGQGNATYTIFDEYVTTQSKTYEFSVRSASTITFDSELYFSYDQIAGTTIQESLYSASVEYVNTTISNSIDLSMSMPDIKVSDFFSGVLKQFNLTCYALNVNTFEIEPLDYWYQKGAVIDVTKHIDIDSIEVAKVPLYSRISFEYQESKSFYNEQFYSNNRRYYGDVSLGYEYDGGEFNVKVPFENLVHTQIETDLQVGYCLTQGPDFKSYLPKPILLYMYEQTTVGSYKLTDGVSTTDTLTTYMPFGQDLLSNGYNYSLNFGKEISSLILNDSPFTLFEIYYESYLTNLFNYKNRLTKVKAIFPTSLITSLKLNDRLVIRDKRYFINSIGSTLTNGEVQLELINDFRRISNERVFTVSSSSGTINIPILVPNGVNDVDVTTSSTGVTLGATTNFTSDGTLEVNYSANPDTLFTMINENGDTEITENIFEIRSEQGTNFVIDLQLESTYFNGDVATDNLYIIQEA
jgi:hypothetical protein